MGVQTSVVLSCVLDISTGKYTGIVLTEELLVFTTLFNHKTTEPAISHSNNISCPRIIANDNTAVVIKMVSVFSIENIVLLYSVIE